MHANDRCTTVAEFDDDVIEGLQRRARDENGNSILVSQDMTYSQWNKEYKTKLILEQGNNNDNKKLKMEWQEKNEKLESKTIKPFLHKNNSVSYRINKYEDKIMELYYKNENENMCLLDLKTGEVIGNITKGKHRTTVNPSLSTAAKMLMKGQNTIIAIHNHPSNHSFSLTDIITFNRTKQIDTMILLTDDYKYYLRTNNNKYTTEYLNKLYRDIEKETKKIYNCLNSVEKRDLTNQKFFKKVGWIYEKEKN